MRNNRKGFTLIELMIVVSIIGILAAIAIPNFQRSQMRSRTMEAQINIAAVKVAQEGYHDEHGVYADNIEALIDHFTVENPFVDRYFEYEMVTNCDGKCYTVGARADLDGDGIHQYWGYIHPFVFYVEDGLIGDVEYASWPFKRESRPRKPTTPSMGTTRRPSSSRRRCPAT